MDSVTKNVLILFAHPSQRRSKVNLPLFRMALKQKGVTAVDLYGCYPTYHIDIEKEKKRLLQNDIIIFQFPLYWYSTPSILKEWQDVVLEYGFAYGEQANALHGKYFLCALTAGGKEQAYSAQGANHFKIRQLLYPFEQMANLTGMHYLAPFVLFGARIAAEDGKVQRHIASYRLLLNALVHDRIDKVKMAAMDNITAATVIEILK